MEPGEEVVNMYLGHGGEFFKPGTVEASVKNAKGVANLEMLKSLMEYSNPDFLTYNTGAVVPLWESGELAMAEIWGSSMGSLLDDEGSTPFNGEPNTVIANAFIVGGGSNPASTLWWDGFSIAKNISDEDAEATFIALVNGVSAEMVKASNDKAVWLMDAYVPGKSAEGVSMVEQQWSLSDETVDGNFARIYLLQKFQISFKVTKVQSKL